MPLVPEAFFLKRELPSSRFCFMRVANNFLRKSENFFAFAFSLTTSLLLAPEEFFLSSMKVFNPPNLIFCKLLQAIRHASSRTQLSPKSDVTASNYRTNGTESVSKLALTYRTQRTVLSYAVRKSFGKETFPRWYYLCYLGRAPTWLCFRFIPAWLPAGLGTICVIAEAPNVLLRACKLSKQT